MKKQSRLERKVERETVKRCIAIIRGAKNKKEALLFLEQVYILSTHSN